MSEPLRGGGGTDARGRVAGVGFSPSLGADDPRLRKVQRRSVADGGLGDGIERDGQGRLQIKLEEGSPFKLSPAGRLNVDVERLGLVDSSLQTDVIAESTLGRVIGGLGQVPLTNGGGVPGHGVFNESNLPGPTQDIAQAEIDTRNRAVQKLVWLGWGNKR